MWVKICGITRPDDAVAALDAGADWLGLNFVAGPRRIDLPTTERIIAAAGRADAMVALLKNDGSTSVVAGPIASTAHGSDGSLLERITLLTSLGIRRIQLYGDAPASIWADFHGRGVSMILPFPAAKGFVGALNTRLAVIGPSHVAAVILDSAAADALGGTGRVADWQSIADARVRGEFASCPPIVLAGGLTPDNVATAIRVVCPAGVDVSSGVEKLPGVKDHVRLRAFVDAARSAMNT